QPIPSDTGNASAFRDAASASPYCVIGTGPGSVIVGWVRCVVSVNCSWICVTTTPVLPFGSTMTVIGTRDGETVGQKKVGTGCGMMVVARELSDTCVLALEWSGVGFVGASVLLHDVASAAKTRTPSARRRCVRGTPGSMWSDMGSLPIESGRCDKLRTIYRK